MVLGPYKILKRIRAVAYKLELPPEAVIHNVFHISQLKKKLGQRVKIQRHPSVLTEEFELQLTLEEVIGIRWNSELATNEWLVRWKGMSASEAVWESVHLLKQQFPTLHLEDKVHFEREGVVRPPIHYTYKRRDKKEKTPEKGIKRDGGEGS